MLNALIPKHDKLATTIIITLSIVVFGVVVALGKFKLLDVQVPFNRYIFAKIIASINSLVSVLLIVGLWAVKSKKWTLHRNTMLSALCFSAIFLVFYIIHHLLNPDTHYGGTGFLKYFYLTVLIVHIVCAACILPFILFTTYRALTGEFERHKKIAKYTFPIWLYVSVSGVLVYYMIAPYYPQ
jgi:putative membrane protein